MMHECRETQLRLLLGVRRVLVVPAFLCPSPLCSINSAAVNAALFADFVALVGDSDFLESFIIGLRPLAFPTRTSSSRSGRLQDIPVPGQGTSEHAGFYDHAGPKMLSR
jgi:hypothetical protein